MHGHRLRGAEEVRVAPDHRRHPRDRGDLPGPAHHPGGAGVRPRDGGGLAPGALPQLREPHGHGDRSPAPRERHPGGRCLPQRAGVRGTAGEGPGHEVGSRDPLEDRGHQPPGVAAGDLAAGRGPLPRDPAPLGSGEGAGHRPGAPRDHAPVRLLRHREQRAHRRVRAVVHQERVPRADRAVQHTARRVPPALRGADRGMAADAGRAGVGHGRCGTSARANTRRTSWRRSSRTGRARSAATC